MNRRLLLPALLLGLLLGALAGLTACGSADGTSETAADAASDPTRAASAAEPTWPASCTDRVTSQIDFGRAPQGWKTPEEAIAHAADSGIPEGTVVVAPGDASSDAVGTMTVWVVDDENTILASVHLTTVPGGAEGAGGLYVDAVERCA